MKKILIEKIMPSLISNAAGCWLAYTVFYMIFNFYLLCTYQIAVVQKEDGQRVMITLNYIPSFDNMIPHDGRWSLFKYTCYPSGKGLYLNRCVLNSQEWISKHPNAPDEPYTVYGDELKWDKSINLFYCFLGEGQKEQVQKAVYDAEHDTSGEMCNGT